MTVRQPLADKPVFVAHGTADKLVSVERARESVAILEKSGARVTFCEAEVGHKVGGECIERAGEVLLISATGFLIPS